MYAVFTMRELPLFTIAPVSPLVDLFILSMAIARSRSLKKEVDSGRSGSRKMVNIPRSIGGIP